MKSIKSKTCANVMNLIQSILIIKNKREATAIQKLINEYGFADIYVYCTKGKPYLNHYDGKVVFKFRCYNVEEITIVADDYYTDTCIFQDYLEKDSCLTYEELDNYLKRKKGYAIHISDLEIFDRPRELCEFKIKDKEGSFKKPIKINAVKYLTKAPRNWCYVED